VKNPKPVIVDCKADWCGPCRVIGPKLSKAVGETNGAVELAIVDVDASPDIAEKLSVSGIPAVFGFHNGKKVDSFVGSLPDAQVTAFVDKMKALAK